MKPTVLFLEQQSWRGGAQRVLDSVLDALAEDFTPLVALPDDGPYAQDLRSRGIETVSYPLGRYRSGKKSSSEMVSFAVRSGWCALGIAGLVSNRKISLIYINAPRALPAGVLAARATRTQTIFHLHRTLSSPTDLFVAAMAVAYVTRIIACSRAAATALTAVAPRAARRTQVVYNPVGQTDLKRGLPPNPAGPSTPTKRVVGLVGRITPQKGHLTLLQAAARLDGEWPNLQIVFVGAPEAGDTCDAAYLGQLQAAAHSLGLNNRVRFVGYQDDPSLLYKQFNVLVAPSLESEGLPMAVLEAASWGIPAVASRVAGMTEVISDGLTGMLVAPGDIDAWADALGTVLRDSDLRSRMGKAARAWVATRFSPESFRGHIQRITAEACGLAASDPAYRDQVQLVESKGPTKA